MTRTNPKQNRNRGANDERDIAAIVGGTRHWANTGGPEDVAHPHYAIQVKGGKQVVSAIMRSALANAREAADGTEKLPMVALVDRSGDRLQRWACFPLEEWAELDAGLRDYGGD